MVELDEIVAATIIASSTEELNHLAVFSINDVLNDGNSSWRSHANSTLLPQSKRKSRPRRLLTKLFALLRKASSSDDDQFKISKHESVSQSVEPQHNRLFSILNAALELFKNQLDGVQVVLLTPEVNSSDHGKIPLVLASSLHKLGFKAHQVAIITTGKAANTTSYIIPPETSHIVFPNEFDELTIDWQLWALAQSLELAMPPVVLSVEDPFTENLIGRYPDIGSEKSVKGLFISHRRLTEPYFERDLGKGFDLLLVDTPEAKDFVELNHPESPPSYAINVYSVPDFNTVVRYGPAFRARYFDSDHPFRILFVSMAGENVPAIQELVRDFTDNHQDVAVDLRCIGPVPENLATKNSGLGEREFIPLPGFLSDFEIENYHTVLVNGESLQEDAIVFQAQLLGIPVFRMADNSFFKHLGLKIHASEPTSLIGPLLTQLIRTLAADVKLRQKLIESGTQHALEQFSSPTLLSQLEEVLGTENLIQES